MSLSTTTNRSDRTLNGVATVFSFDFKIFSESDLQVILVDGTTGAESTLTLGVDYTVSGVNADAGSITLVAGPGTSGDKLVLKRVLQLTQPTRLRNQGDFFPATHERAFDRSVMISQQLKEELDRVPHLSSQVEGFGTDLGVPAPLDVMAVNAAGDSFEFRSIDEIATASYTITTVKDHTATAGQTVFATAAPYVPHTNGIAVYRNGVRLVSISDYTETDENSITLTVGADLGDTISVVSSEGVEDPTGVAAANTLRSDLASTASGKGVGLVGYLSSLAGAVADTLSSWLWGRDASVWDFMTLAQKVDARAGTLNLDMTSAFQAAIDALPLNTASVGILTPKGFPTGGTIKIPRGLYKITGTLNLHRGIRFSGESHEASQIASYCTGPVFYYEDAGRYVQDELVFENFSVWQNSGVVPVSGGAISVVKGTAPTASVQLSVKNVLVEGTYYGIEMTSGVGCQMDGCRIGSTKSHGIYIWNDGVTTTSTTLKNNYTEQCAGDGVHVTTGSYVSLIGCASDSNTGYGYNIQNVQCCNMVACGAEGNVSGGMFVKDSDAITFSLRTASVKDTDAVQLNNCRNTVSIGSYFDMADSATATAGYGINVVVSGGAVTCVGTSFIGTRYAANKCNATTNVLILDGTSGLVGSGGSWALNTPSRAIDATAGFLLSGNLGSSATRAQVINNTHTAAGASRNAQLFLQGITAATAVTYPLVTNSYSADIAKGSGSTVTRAAGHIVVMPTAGANANAAFYVESGGTSIPVGNWAFCSTSTNDSLYYGGARYISNTGPLERWGSGTPEGVLSAPVGSVFHRTDGGAGTCLYIKESGTGNTGWVAK